MSNHRQHYLDANTSKYPRSMNEAFGAGPHFIDDDDVPMDWQDKLVIAGSVICALAVVVLALGSLL